MTDVRLADGTYIPGADPWKGGERLKSYRYAARDLGGKLTRGTIDADSPEEVYQKLKENNLYCVGLERFQDRELRQSREKMKIRDVSFFCRQLSTMLSAGLTVVRAVDILYERTPNKRVKASFLQIMEDIQKGLSFYEALHEQGSYYPALLQSMVQAGERSGTLDEVMLKMADHYEREYRLLSKLRTSMAYPVFLLIVTLLVMVGLFVFVLPSFFTMFEGGQVPIITRLVMGISNFLIYRWYVLLIALAAFTVLFLLLRQLPRVRMALDRMKMQLPLMGKQLRTIYVARFTHALSILYASGIPMIDAVEMAVSVLGNAFVTRRFESVTSDISRGEMLSASIQRTGLFDSMVSAMIYIGEESGSLDQMLIKLSAFYDAESEQAMQKLAALLEPVMLVIIAILIGLVVAAVILPIYSMYSSVI